MKYMILIAALLISGCKKRNCNFVCNDGCKCAKECVLEATRGGYNGWYETAVQRCYRDACRYEVECK